MNGLGPPLSRASFSCCGPDGARGVEIRAPRLSAPRLSHARRSATASACAGSRRRRPARLRASSRRRPSRPPCQPARRACRLRRSTALSPFVVIAWREASRRSRSARFPAAAFRAAMAASSGDPRVEAGPEKFAQHGLVVACRQIGKPGVPAGYGEAMDRESRPLTKPERQRLIESVLIAPAGGHAARASCGARSRGLHSRAGHAVARPARARGRRRRQTSWGDRAIVLSGRRSAARPSRRARRHPHALRPRPDGGPEHRRDPLGARLGAGDRQGDRPGSPPLVVGTLAGDDTCLVIAASAKPTRGRLSASSPAGFELEVGRVRANDLRRRWLLVLAEPREAASSRSSSTRPS